MCMRSSVQLSVPRASALQRGCSGISINYRTREAKIILGAAVIDDVLGLVILAIISWSDHRSEHRYRASLPRSIIWLITKVAIFLVGSMVLGIFFVPRVMRQVAKAKSKGMLFTFALAFCFLLSYLCDARSVWPPLSARLRPGSFWKAFLFRSFCTKTSVLRRTCCTLFQLSLCRFFFLVWASRSNSQACFGSR